MNAAVRRTSPLELAVSAGLVCLIVLLPLSHGGRTSFARAMLATGVFSLISLVLISPHKNVFLQILPLPWLALVVLLVGASLFTSIFKDFSVKEALTLSSIISGSILAGHVAWQGRDRPILVALIASGVISSLLAAPAYLSALLGSGAASALSGSFHYPNGLGSFLL
ncbi:MAG: hypothetical protein HY278_07475, partial [candidate division NC10 bacterium]|nr:hypothetical protein [candidate division NC10 bacterium]